MVICLLPWVVATRQGRWAAILLLIGLAVAWWFKPSFFSLFFARWRNLASFETWQNEQRWWIWQGAWRMFWDHPWAGVGMGAWRVGKIQLAYGLRFWDYVSPSAHSGLLQMASELGIPGLIAWAALLWRLIRSGIALVRYYRLDVEMRPWVLALLSNLFLLILGVVTGDWLLTTGLDKPSVILIYMWFAAIVSMADKARAEGEE